MTSVTQALRLAGLVDTTWFTLEARDRGSAVHRAIHYHNEGDLDEDTLTDERVRARFMSYRKFVEDTGFVSSANEVELKNEGLGLVGHPDMIGKPARHNYLWVVDCKPMGEQDWHGLQLAAYAKLAKDHGYPVRLRYNLYLGEKRNYKLVPRTNPRDWSVFRAALTVAQFKEAA